jgi:hypothetical protein
MQTIKLELPLAEVNQLLDALGDKPYKQVYQLIQQIQGQAEAQLRQATADPDDGLEGKSEQ